MTITTWNMVITLVAAGITLLIAGYSWSRYRPIALALPLWLALAWLLSRRGFFADAGGWTDGDLIGFTLFGTLMTLPVVLFFVARARSAAFRHFLDGVPAPLLIGVQVYRVAGIVFLWLYARGWMPLETGLITGLADLIVGAAALPLAWAVARNLRGSRAAAIAWNVFGIADFVLAISFVSLSTMGAVTLQPAPVRIGLHPLALISLFQVPLSICLHWLALRAVSQRAANPAVVIEGA